VIIDGIADLLGGVNEEELSYSLFTGATLK
jgi:hypothetical protein